MPTHNKALSCGDDVMKLLRFLGFLLPSAGVLLSPFAALSQAPNQDYGPPRAETVEGDVAAAALSSRELENLRAFTRLYTLARWFHPSDAAFATDWDRFAIEAIPPVLAAQSPDELADTFRLQFAPRIDALELSRDRPSMRHQPAHGAHWQWIHRGYEGALTTGYNQRRATIPASAVGPPHVEQLPGGLWVSMPLTAPVTTQRQPTAEARSGFSHKPDGWIPAGFDRSTRLAGVVIAWGIVDQFYPYWDVVDVDWDEILPEMLQDAAQAKDDRAYRDVLDAMMIAMQDGHAGTLYHQRYSGRAPLRLRLIEGQLVVVAATPEAGVELGAIVETIDGLPASEEISRRMQVGFSGSLHFRRYWTVTELPFGEKGSTMVLGLVHADGSREEIALERLDKSEVKLPRSDRPDSLTEIEEGVLYVDLTRIDNDLFNQSFERIAAAHAVVFDVRGGPRVRSSFLANLSDSRTVSAKFLMPTFLRPDQEGVSFRDLSWQIEPATPRFPSNLVFLTNARAISYPESLLGLIKGNELAPIVGSPTAGANGNMTAIDLPGGYRLFFTGLKVINQDGTVHHNIGVQPDLFVEPTIEGIRSGRDEVLEAGLRLVRTQMEAN